MFISICIPTYKSSAELERLLDSLNKQTFTDYEVVISDDSPDESVKGIIDEGYAEMKIRYFHNGTSLGTPQNWNNAVAQSQGEWIKLMHHDDWFYNENSLMEFVKYAQVRKDANFIFCAFQNHYLDVGTTEKYYCSPIDILLLRVNRLNLFKTFMGNPSCTLIHCRNKPYSYDSNFKWLIDFDFYTSLFKKNNSFIYIDKVLVSVGMHKGQVTASVFQNPKVEVPESIALIEKHGTSILKNIFVYDFFWRMYRNLGVRSMEEFNSFLNTECNYAPITDIINAEGRVPQRRLKIGFISKFYMFISFVKNYFHN